ncbi:MAG: DUF6316 family protein [Pseudomonadota bacterium]
MTRRASDPETTSIFQSDRFFEADGQWYFSTRETPDQGPYLSRELALRECTAFLRTQVGVPADIWDRPGGTS